MGKTDEKKSSERPRLSVDLNAYPDVRDMLIDACDATGADKTEYTIAALRKYLPALIEEAIEERRRKMDRLQLKYTPLGKQKPKVA